MKHLSFDELAKFREGALEGAELLAADDHLSGCAECRENLKATPEAFRNWVELADGMRAAARVAEPHISFESMRAFADGKTSAVEGLRLESHLLECQSCRNEVTDLKAFAAELKQRNAQPSRWNRYLIFGPIAAALLVGVLWMRPQPQEPPAPLAISLRDAGKTIGLDRHGSLVGSPATGSNRDALVAALQDGRIAVTIPDGLRSGHSVLLGSDDGEKRFRVLSPVGEPVLQEAPEFRWEAVDGARGYKVQVFDADYQQVAASPEVTGTAWTPDQALERGKRYAWQVTAIRNGQQLKAPQPPDAEARFLIVAGPDAESIQLARQASAGHLELATRYAHAGLCREALSEIDALERENSGSALVQQLRAGLSGQCGSSTPR